MSKLYKITRLILLLLLTWPIYGYGQTFETKENTVAVEKIITGLKHPWSVAFLPNNRFLITERSGQLLVASKNGMMKKVNNVPVTLATGQGGLLDVAVDNEFYNSKNIFFSYSKPVKNTQLSSTTVASAELIFEKNKYYLKKIVDIFSQSKPSNSFHHFGSRIVLTPDEKLYITVGDRGDRKRAQDPFDHAGSTIRINKDGSIPVDNPFNNSKNGLPEIWSIGHRNPQGAIWNPKTQSVWTVEHGAKGGDEINEILSGRNYGWPIISYGEHYWGGKIGEGTHKKGLEQPKYFWDPSIAPSGFCYYNGSKFKNWTNQIFVGALKYKMISRLAIEENRIVEKERLFSNKFGRIRDVRQGPDGLIYFLTDESDGGLFSIKPLK